MWWWYYGKEQLKESRNNKHLNHGLIHLIMILYVKENLKESNHHKFSQNTLFYDRFLK
jgi:hypothetical protein